MINKKKNILCSLLTLLLMSSCNWLEVSPSNEVNADDMYSNGDGYRNALNGLYLQLSGSTLYGKNMSWGFIEVLGQQYLTEKMKATEVYAKAASYKYDDTDVKSIISGLWTESYNAIAGCNKLISMVSEADPALFVENEMERDLVWGEALALRALFHFDILRMFAPSMEVNDGKSYIPYVDSYPVISTAYYSNADILKKIEADLLKAQKLVAKCDVEKHPVWMETEYRMFGKGLAGELPEEVFFAFRGFRMNYYAVTALLARVYMWEKEYKKAFDCADEVTKASNNKKTLFGFTETLSGDMKDCTNLIFSVNSETLLDDYKPFVTSGNDNLFLFNVEDIYEGSSEDQRGKVWVSNLGSLQYSKKYLLEESETGYDVIPVLRLSEMYYIMAEYYAQNGNFTEAGKMVDKVRSARGLISSSSNFSSMEDFRRKLLKEMRKEFVGEGQLYFQYKRFNNKSLSDNVKFVFDLPENEDI